MYFVISIKNQYIILTENEYEKYLAYGILPK